MATIDIVKEILSENLDIDAETVTPEATFEGLGIDSLDMVELISEIEDRCEVEFGEPEGLETIEQLCTYIDGLK
ncbi:phosphopantetheine-binding protein [Slackia equolifaciens]|uniref:Acyl carrier protein n=1 Tax=Slackia equolifaciens TaxID=498718 RepID=A0A3N0B4Z8_9ACTN|nr:acyl carrier protein [Slackia equolifaciens]RNL41894.1 phosphopantetheine-binding protein [Slackia equolifaciens]HJF64869.1 acyl carrier protein [Slackia equolifaciens]